MVREHIGAPELVLVSHSHWDHLADVPYIAKSPQPQQEVRLLRPRHARHPTRGASEDHRGAAGGRHARLPGDGRQRWALGVRHAGQRLLRAGGPGTPPRSRHGRRALQHRHPPLRTPAAARPGRPRCTARTCALASRPPDLRGPRRRNGRWVRSW
ncbi:hypothetical protein [Streptomyces mirabilis]|uniref:hypothetical protein n=1 Tax=Streptomyces mirabilis TaxID=68239 RepID=UPI0036CAF336